MVNFDIDRREATGEAVPHFLFSYARQDIDAYLDEFYADLRRETRSLVGCALENTGFMDYRDIEVGADWAGELVDALCTCDILVAVYSPSYFKRPNCGKEWAVMAERITRLRDDQGGRLPNILPVNWVPAPEMPEVGKRVQWWDARFGPEYAEKGLRWIARRKKKDDLEERYEDVVTALATSIRDLVIAPHRLPELTPRPTWDEVTQAFPVAAPAGPVDPPTAQPAARLGTGGPDNVHIVVLAGSREEMSAVRDELDFYGRDSHDWRPFQPVKEGRLSAYALERIAGRGINAFLQPTGRPLGDVLDEAGRANEVVVILLDAWSAGVPRYQEQLELYDERNEVTAVVIAPRSRDDRESMARATEIHQLLRQAMPRSMVRRDPLFKYGSATLPAFRHQLDKAILEAQQRSFQLAEVHRRFPPAGPAQPPRLAGP